MNHATANDGGDSAVDLVPCWACGRPAGDATTIPTSGHSVLHEGWMGNGKTWSPCCRQCFQLQEYLTSPMDQNEFGALSLDIADQARR